MSPSDQWPQRTLSKLPRRRSGRSAGVAALVGFGLLAGSAAPAQAATDSLYAAPSVAGAGDCSSPADACTIATAVTNANAEPVADSVRIVLASGTYQLPSPTPTALVVTFAGPSLTFEAASGTPTLNGKKATQLLSIGATSNVTIDGLQLEFGSAAGLGGAIQNNGTLTVRNSTFSSNSASNGGAIANAAGGTLAIEGSTLSHNATTGVGGGAIISMGAATVERSAIIDNDAPINGGGINVQSSGTVTLSSSTVAGNTSGGLGGGLSNLGTLDVQASTITDNVGSDGAVIATGNANVRVAASILAAPSSVRACSPANTAIVDGGYNLDDDGTCIAPDSPASGSHSGTTAYGSSTYGAVLDAYLADGLADNGGPTRTVALLNSPDPLTTLANPAFDVVPPSFDLPVAVDGVSAACSLSDQRGVVPAAGANCDIGAYLLQATKTALVASAAKAASNASVTYTATVTPAPDKGTVSFDDGAGNPATTHCAAQAVTSGAATCTVSYANSGSYQVTAAYSGDGATNDFAASASTAQTVVVTPPTLPAPTLKLSKLTATRCMGTARGAHKNVTVGYTLSAPSHVTFTLQRRVKPPTGSGTACPRAPPSVKPGDYANVHGSSVPALTRSVTLTAAPKTHVLAKTVAVGAGSHRFGLKTLLGSTSLKPGRYRVLVQAVSTAGAKAQSAAYFRVLQPKRPKQKAKKAPAR